jgi:hypothetical protein
VKFASITAIAAAAVLAAGGGAGAAELPSRDANSPTSADKAKTCTIDGAPGVVMPGSDVCMRISGAVNATVSGGSLSKQYRSPGAP